MISVLQDICELLEEEGTISFFVSGFGDPNWPLDIATDLCVILEQLPLALTKLANETGEFELDFYEQGVERRLNCVIQNEK